MANVDYTKALQDYKNSQILGQRSLKRYRNAGPGTALATALSGYFAGQGMNQAQGRMGDADKAENDANSMAMSQALGAFRGDTTATPNPADMESGLGSNYTQEGTGQNVNAMAQSLMGSGREGYDKLGLAMLAREGKAEKGTSLMQNLVAAGYTPGSPEYNEAMRGYLSKSDDTNVTVHTGGELPKGWQYIDPTNPRLGAQPIPKGPADADYLAEKKLKEMQASQQVKDETKKAANLKAYETYKVTTENVMRSIQQTATGFFAGKVPAIEASAQIAEHANNVLFPAIKKLVRDGESGVFTDQDALDVRKLLPTRETHPDALPMVMWQLDSWVASKMGQPQPPMPQQGGGDLMADPTPEQYKELSIGDKYLWEGTEHTKGQ